MKLSDIFEIYLPEYEGNQSQFDIADLAILKAGAWLAPLESYALLGS